MAAIGVQASLDAHSMRQQCIAQFLGVCRLDDSILEAVQQ
jgi:hypothetical protein